MSTQKKIIAPYGSWRSPITSALIVEQSIGLSEVRRDGDEIYWLEARPQERGRNVVVRWRGAGKPAQEINPRPYNARNRAHEYGGGAWAVSRGLLYFSNFADGRLYRQDGAAAQPQPLTPAPRILERDWRYADGLVDRGRKRWIGVREDHTARNRQYPENSIVAVALTGAGSDPGRVLASGHDFFSSPRLSPDGRRLAWLAWDHPNMPWTGTVLYMAALGADGMPIGAPVAIAGGPKESLYQPEWSPDGKALFVVSDRSGWWNLHRCALDGGAPRPVAAISAEFARAQWQFGMSSYAFAGRDRIIAAYSKGGIGRLARLDLATGKLEPLDLPFTEFASVQADGRGRVLFCAGAPHLPAAVVRLDLGTGHHEILKQSTEVAQDPAVSRCFAAMRPIRFRTKGGKQAYGLFYPPSNPGYAAPKGEKPPLVVKCHGGPTSAASSSLDLRIHYWTSRGIAVLDLNYGGSTGYGREYRDRLHLKWGVVDVDDAVNGAKFLARQGWADGRRAVITGGSAGGFTALAALTFRDHFQAGASHYGISDIAALAEETHKFEAHYMDWLIGPYPQTKARYRARSPIFHAKQLTRPVIFFQGSEDRIVPPNQTEKMVETLRRKGIEVGYLLFSGEGHGFRQAANIQRALDAELYFYSFALFGTKLSF
jgi:dipeptidyl aminopeptidase/acylaminoacyl peptidase